MQYRSRCCHSDNCCKTMSVVRGIKAFKRHFTAENGELLSHVFRESSRKCISDTWMPRKKNPALRKVRERDGEREDRIEHKVTGFWQPLNSLLTCFFFGGFGLKAESSNGETTCPNNMRTVWG